MHQVRQKGRKEYLKEGISGGIREGGEGGRKKRRKGRKE